MIPKLFAVFCCAFILNGVAGLCAAETLSQSTALPRVLIEDFVNLSDWKENVWNIEKLVADKLTEALNKTNKMEAFHSKDIFVENPVANNIYRYSIRRTTFSGADFLVKGVIRNFSFRLLAATSYAIAGYEEIYAKVKLSGEIWSPSGKRAAPPVFGEHEISRKNVGASLAGGPIGDDRTVEFMKKIYQSSFTSTLVQESPIGMAVQAAVEELVPKICQVVLGTPMGLRGKIVESRGDDIYLDVGSDDGVKEGQEFRVTREKSAIKEEATGKFLGYAEHVTIGRVRVFTVKNRHLSIANPVGDIKAVRLGDRVVME